MLMLTMTLETLVHETIEQGAAVITEGWTGVAVSSELVNPRLAQPSQSIVLEL